jgi:uncharacterized protein YbjT (DUF2867 family)
MASPTVIVFGPTGAVGSAAAQTAADLGAKVVLAMRDTAKAIPGLGAAKENEGAFQRVRADLLQPETVREAVKSTGATRAFMYAAHGSQDSMKATVLALKEAGVSLIVFLSSFTVRGDISAIPPSDAIPYGHAKIEMTLTEIVGQDGFVAVRPGNFASNTLQYKPGLASGKVMVALPDSQVDCIVPKDIGRVCGTILVNGPPPDGERTPYLYGPQLIKNRDLVKLLLTTLGKEAVAVEDADNETAYKMFTEQRRLPPLVAKYMVDRGSVNAGPDSVYGYKIMREELSNVEKYSGRKGTSILQWLEENKTLFLA